MEITGLRKSLSVNMVEQDNHTCRLKLMQRRGARCSHHMPTMSFKLVSLKTCCIYPYPLHSIASKNMGKIMNKIYTHAHQIKVSNQFKLLVWTVERCFSIRILSWKNDLSPSAGKTIHHTMKVKDDLFGSQITLFFS